ncbi:MAG: HD domain-containing protein [Bacteroidales bacterium]|nr:HD domain-containing protein [Clostridium sp.]MCM1203183.1 HD domain-containing protein [Bacteroidales bacterium]
MERIDRLMNHPVYRENLKQIEKAEQERIFCGHGLTHALDVARILYIMVLERSLSFAKDLVYAAALLHDIGRYEQYANQAPHDEAGVRLALTILPDCGYDIEEIRLITEAIQGHNSRDGAGGWETDDSLDALLYRADKLSRNCFDCQARKECYWQEEMQNKALWY